MTEPTPDTDRTGDPQASTGTVSVADRYADRYGRGRGPLLPRRTVIALLSVMVVLAGLGIAYIGWSKFGPKDIESEQLGYTVLDDSSVELKIRLTRADPTRPVVCVVRAMTQDLTEVGRREVVVQPSPGEQTVRLSTVIETTERPSSATIYMCSEDVPGYLRTE